MGQSTEATEPEVSSATTEHILIDYENAEKFIKSDDFRLMTGNRFDVTVFCGPTQKKISVEVVAAIHRAAREVDYIQVEKPGKEALDLHIAYYLGRLSSETPQTKFHIIAEDGGYTSLVDHLRGRGLRVQKHRSIKDLPLARESEATPEKLLKDVIRFLSELNPQPDSLESLQSALRGRFGLGKKIMAEILRLLDVRVTEEGRVKYAPNLAG